MTEEGCRFPSTSRTDPMSTRAIVKPTPMPIASAIDSRIGFFDANASARPRITQLTTMRAMKAAISWCAAGSSACRVKSATVTKVAITTT